jgi:hypothetical protein
VDPRAGRHCAAPLDGARQIVIRGELRPHPEARGIETTAPDLAVMINSVPAGELRGLRPGPWEMQVTVPAAEKITLALSLQGTGFTNLLAWLGRVTGLGGLQRFRRQNENRQLRLGCIALPTGELIYDFSRRDSPYAAEYARKHVKLGLNIVGFLTADLGVGESARCMVRAADAAGIPSALVPLKLNCKNRLGDQTYADRLQDANPTR